MAKLLVLPKAFSSIQTVNAEELENLSEKEIRPLLPCLVRMALCSPLDQSSEWSSKRKIILRLLSGIELVNHVVGLLSIDFHGLEIDVKKEQQLRMKLGGHLGESILVSSLQNGLTLEFERSDAARKLRLLLSELLAIMSQIKDGRVEVNVRQSELFDTDIYLEEVSDVLCIAKAELPGLLQITDIAEALIRVKNGPGLLCRLVANSPDCFREVCFGLISNGEKQDEETVGGRIRMQTLHMLCQMNMSQALTIRAKTVEMCCMPGLAVQLTLDHCRHEHGDTTDFNTIVGDLVAFISGLLLGSDDKVRSWFAQYVRNCQKRTEEGNSTLHQLREELLQRLQNLVLFSIDQHNLPDCKVVQASALLRLYCALRGIAGLKFNEDEINLLLELLTSHPPPSPAGIRFVSLGLCMLMACPSLLNTVEHENRSKKWIQWLVKEESYFGRTSGVSASFGEMLLLIAIHFHSNQINSIADLVCSTLGMRIPIRSNNLVRMKTIFTQEIFTDQIVTAHAVKVPVTPNLSRNTSGFLPVHCIHQLLKSRAFTKHKVPIKDWIYKQICNTVPPLHPVLPALIEVYVNSVLIPSSKGTHDTTNEPITEEEILSVFKNSVFIPHDVSSKIGNQIDSEAMDVDKEEKPASLTSQLLLLYYLLLYEDTRLSNMKMIISCGRKVKKYTSEFMSQLPIFYLLQQAQKDQQMYAGLFSPLLRLLATNCPHLCLVESWLAEEGNKVGTDFITIRGKRRWPPCTKETLDKAFQNVQNCPYKLLQQLEYLLTLPLYQLWPFALPFVNNLQKLLEPNVPREILEKSKRLWWKLNRVFPRRLWLITVNALQPPRFPSTVVKPLTLDNIVLDPLHVLRCDERIFRCAPLLEIVLHMLQAFLAASRTHLAHHMLEHPSIDKVNQVDTDKNREELRSALVASQESAAVQILLECCRPSPEDKEKNGLLTELREVQSLICSHVHQVFISDPHLAKLVHFQGYPSELLSVTVSSIPSMHICLDFIPELLSQPHLEKQVFAIELASYLCLEYAIPKSLSIAKLCINVAHTLLGVIPSEQHPVLFVPALPALVRMCKAFPPLCEDVATLLLQLGKVCLSHSCVINSVLLYCPDFSLKESDGKLPDVLERLPSNSYLSQTIKTSFSKLCDIVVFNHTIY
ncbi:integrator complex subunit 2 isoform X1 [Centruroides vittatus]|uniref:integrator complex subunit 2 isoform X1 n=1 Tax=Centruroides vittatus TaxID=120091 RepID=UPI00350F7880